MAQEYEPYQLGFVVSQTNYDVTFLMKERALEHTDFLGIDVPYIIEVPGVFEIPFAVQELLENTDVDAVVTLGAVVKGDTDHDQIVAQHAARKIMDLALEFGKPVSLGISGPGMSPAQAKQRIESFVVKAVESAVKLLQAQQDLRLTQISDEDEEESEEQESKENQTS